jgi:hypothetical protein
LFDVLPNIPQTPEGIQAAGLWLNWGTADADYTDCRLIKQNISGQTGPYRKPVDEPPQLVRVYEEISATAETQVGEPGITFDQYDNKIVTINWIQFSAGTATYQIPGQSTYGNAVLLAEERTNDGTLQYIKRTYTTGGILSDTEELKFNGKLVIRTIKSLNEAIVTPPGYTLITEGTEYTRGLPIYVNGYANGGGGGGGGTGGQISESTVYRQSSDEGETGVTVTTIQWLTDASVDTNPIPTPSGFVLIATGYEDETGYRLWTGTYAKGIGEVSRDISYGQSIDEGATGVTVTKITHLTASTVTENPTTAPGGSVLIALDHSEADGYRVWNVTYAEGVGTVSTSIDYKDGGLLVIYRVTALGEAPDAPAATIGGTVTLISTNVRNADGYQVFDYTWAEGNGEVGRSTSYSQSSDQGTTGVTVITITYLAALTETTNPITPPGGTVLIAEASRNQDGYLVWTASYAVGTGTVMTSEEIRNNGALLIQNIRSLGSAPSTPSGFTIISTRVTEGDGYQIFDYGFANGTGEISRDTDWAIGTTEGSETTGLTKVTIRYITTPSQATHLPATLSGFVIVSNSLAEQDGYRIWTTVWAKGSGEISRDISYRQSDDEGVTGVTIYTIKHLTAPSVGTNPITPPSSTVLIDIDKSDSQGYRVWTGVYAKGTGLVDDQVDIQNNGNLYLYRRVALNAAPSTPSSSTGGTVTLTSTDVRMDNGYEVYTYTWVEGEGEISRDTAYFQSANQGTTGTTIVSIRYLVAPAGTVQPTSLSGFVNIGQDVTEGNGYRIWTTKWAKGTGLVLDEVDITASAALVIYHRIALGGAPTTPSATISGTVTLFESSVRADNGYDVYDYRWAEGDGQTSITTAGQEDGALVYTVVTTSAAASTPAYPGSGTAYLVRLNQEPKGGYFVNTAVYQKPPATTTLKRQKQFTMPGIASFVSNNLVVNPPSERTILADEEISYSVTQDSTAPFSVEYGAYYQASYIRANNNDVGEYERKALPNILSGAESCSGTNDFFNGVLCTEFEGVISSSSPTSRPTGDTLIAIDNSIYLTAIDGTRVYRIVKVSYSF